MPLQQLDKLVGEEESRLQQDVGAAQGAVGGMVEGISRNLQNRWWEKEAQEFQETASSEFTEAVSTIGRMAGDDSVVDDAGAMETYITAVKNYIGKAAQYKDNPIIAKSVKDIMDHIGGIGDDLLSGERGLRAAQTDESRAGAYQKTGAGILSRARAGALGGGPGKNPFGLDPAVLKGTQTQFHLNLIKDSKVYKDRKFGEDGAVIQKVRNEWSKLTRVDRVRFDNDIKKFASTVSLTQEEENDFDAAQLREHFSFMNPNSDSFTLTAMVEKAIGPNRLAIRQNVDGTKSVKIPVRLDDVSMDRAILNWSDIKHDGQPPPALEDIISLREIEKKHKGSALHTVSDIYMKLRRLEGTSHEEAINMISLSPEQGGSGLIDKLAGNYFDMTGRSSNVTDSNIKNYRNKLIQFMDDQLRGAIEEEDYAIRIEEGEVGPLERVGRAIGTIFGPIQDVLRDDIHPLASSGKRTGGRILPYTPKEPFDPSLMPEKLIWGVGKLKEPKVR